MSSQDDQSDVPVLTQVVDDAAPADVDDLARELERALLERLAPELERLVREAVAEALAVTRRG